MIWINAFHHTSHASSIGPFVFARDEDGMPSATSKYNSVVTGAANSCYFITANLQALSRLHRNFSHHHRKLFGEQNNVMKGPSSKLAANKAISSTINEVDDTAEGHNTSELVNGSDPPPVYKDLVKEVNIAQEDFNASATILGMFRRCLTSQVLDYN